MPSTLPHRRRAHAAPTDLFVRQRGHGEPLVLVHGLASSSRNWGDLLPLAERYRVTAPDLLGFGRSPKPRAAAYTAAEHVAALHAALTRRVHRPFALVGHSLGSLIALHYAATYPDDVSALILMSLPVVSGCTWGHEPDGGMDRWHRLSVHSRGGTAAVELGMHAARPLWEVIAPIWRVLRPHMMPGAPPNATRDALQAAWYAYWRSLEHVVYDTDVPALLAQVRAPVSIIHGSVDRTTPIEPVRALVHAHPQIHLTELAGANHNPYYTFHLETVAAMDAAITRSRASVASAGRPLR